jgi:nucleotide-binding universal stress UspA family protein
MNLFLPLATYPDPVDEGHLTTSVEVAVHLGATITAAGVEVNIPDVKNKFAEAILNLSEQIRAAERASSGHAARLMQKLADIAGGAGIAVSADRIRAKLAFLDDAVVRHAHFHDLVVLPAPPGDVTAKATAETVIFGSGRPVLLLPGGGAAPPKLGTVVLATDFSRVATRAMFDALPFITRATKIQAVTAVDEKDVSHGNRAALAAFFARQGLAAEILQIESRGKDLGMVLQDHLDQLGGGLLVMGAFGHSRMRDFVLGGVTRSVLADLRHPVLMSS